MKSVAGQHELPKFKFLTDQFGEVTEVRQLKYKYVWDEEKKGVMKVPRAESIEVWRRED